MDGKRRLVNGRAGGGKGGPSADGVTWGRSALPVGCIWDQTEPDVSELAAVRSLRGRRAPGHPKSVAMAGLGQ